jgi:hypothetical protein
LALLAMSSGAQASTGELFGYGSRASAMGNTMLAGTSDGFATFYNPGANSTHPGIGIALATTYAHPSFTGIDNIVVDNSATSSELNNKIGNVDTSNYLDTLEQGVAATMNFGEKFKYMTLGLTAFIPIVRVAYLDSNDPFLPEYVQYRSRTQRPQIYASLSASPIKALHLAMGLALSTNLSAVNNARITTVTGMVSSQRFASTIKPGAAPYFAAYADPENFRVGGVIRLPNRYKVNIDTDAHTYLLSTTNDLEIVLNSSSSIYYDPLEIDFGVGEQITPETFITFEGDWLQYAAFESPVLTVTNNNSGPAIHNSISSLPAMRNILVGKFGLEHTLDAIKPRIGYMYRPSEIKDNSGPGNLVDPTRHTITIGAGVDLKKAKVTDKDLILDLHAQYSFLVTSHITKSAGNETGDPTQSKVGSPGYDIGGHIIGAGLSLSMNF